MSFLPPWAGSFLCVIMLTLSATCSFCALASRDSCTEFGVAFAWFTGITHVIVALPVCMDFIAKYIFDIESADIVEKARRSNCVIRSVFCFFAVLVIATCFLCVPAGLIMVTVLVDRRDCAHTLYITAFFWSFGVNVIVSMLLSSMLFKNTASV